MKNISIYIQLFFLIPIILLLFIIRIFKNFRINKIISHKIGHLATPMEIYICERKDDSNKIPIIWFFDKKIANQFLKKQWLNKLLILPRYILEPIYILFRKFKFFKFFLEDFSKETELVKRTLKDGVKQIDEKNVLFKQKPSIEFSDKEKNEGENYLKKVGFQNKKLITFSSRTSEFHNEKMKSNRNSDIYNQIPGVKFLISKDYRALRLGKNVTEKINVNDQNIIDYATSRDRSDFLDVYKVSKCEFMISSESGINEIAVIFRKPILIVDHYYWRSCEKYSGKVMLLPKKFRKLDTGKLLNFGKAHEKFNQIDDPATVSKLGYEVIDSSQIEIKKAAESMFHLINNGSRFDEIFESQKKFWNNLEKEFGYKKNNKVIICPDFYLNNIDLFE